MNVERLKAGEDAREGLSKDWQTFPFPWVYNSVHGRFERLCTRLGIEHRGLHCFRHTLITKRLASGVPIQAVAALAGHSSVATTDRRYNHTSALSYAAYVD